MYRWRNFAGITLAGCAAFGLAKSSKTQPPITKVYQFEPGNWVEAMRWRSSGKLLVNLLSTPDVYEIDTKAGSAVHVTNIPVFTGLYGLTEVAEDQFYVAGGKFVLQNSTHYHGTYAVYHVNMTSFDPGCPGSVVPVKVADFPEAALNGMTTVNAKAGLVMVADNDNGVVYTLNVNTGAASITIDDPTMKFPPNASLKLTVNGINIRDGYLYFTNTAAGTLVKVPINETTGHQTGPGVVLATTPEGRGGDDWTFDDAGNAYIADDPYNWVNLIRPGSSTPEIVIGGPNSSAVLGPTAARFGVSSEDKANESLYVSTSGGIAQYQAGNYTIGGGVYRVDLRGQEGGECTL